MTSLHQPHSSFVIRIWWEETNAALRQVHSERSRRAQDVAADSRPIWRGWVQHIRSGEATCVQDLEGLLGFIERWTGKLSNPDGSPTRPK